MDLNRNQWIAIGIAILGVLAVSTAQLTDLFGATTAKSIVSGAGLLNSILASILAVLTGNGSTIKDLSQVQGVEPIRINKDASRALARVALDPNVENVGPVAKDAATLKQIATGDLSQ